MNQTSSKPFTLALGPQLLLDSYLVDDIWMIRRSPELPVKYLENPIFDATSTAGGIDPGVQTILYDEQEDLFKMWYGITDRSYSPPGYPYMSTMSYTTHSAATRGTRCMEEYRPTATISLT